jgi:hypothetical protein
MSLHERKRSNLFTRLHILQPARPFTSHTSFLFSHTEVQLFQDPSHLTSKAHIALTITVLVSVLRTMTESALVTSVVVLPCLGSILEHDRIVIAALRLNLHSPWQMARYTERLGCRIDSSALHRADDLLRGVVYDDIEGIISANAELVALVLDDMHCAPAW